jgi:L-2-hydroxyglutarate oxidase LhgO
MRSSHQVEAVVVGAGIVGLAIARALSQRGLKVLLLEKERAIGTGTSSRNSEVIHAGLYYEPGSLKARLCVEGNRRLYRYCAERGVPHRRCGKLVVATEPGEDAALEALRARAETNGVADLTLLGAAELKRDEPDLHASSALHAPSSGIVYSHALMLALQADAENAGCTIALRTPVLEAALVGGTVTIRTGGAEPFELEADLLVNAAGLDAWDLAGRLHGLDPATIPPRFLAKGSYFILSGAKAPFRHQLIYPLPVPGSLGVHLTLDMGGQTRFGPDLEWTDRIDYAVDATRAESFYAAIRRYWPGLPDGALVPAYCGIRPKIVKDGFGDFAIQGPARTGHQSYIGLYGIESPGLTSSLAIAEHVADLASA